MNFPSETPESIHTGKPRLFSAPKQPHAKTRKTRGRHSARNDKTILLLSVRGAKCRAPSHLRIILFCKGLDQEKKDLSERVRRKYFHCANWKFPKERCTIKKYGEIHSGSDKNPAPRSPLYVLRSPLYVLRFTLYASRFTLYAPRVTSNGARTSRLQGPCFRRMARRLLEISPRTTDKGPYSWEVV